MDADDEKLELSSGALAALRQFYSERDSEKQRFEELKAAAASKAPLTIQMFKEDWGASQFWNSEETATTLAKELLSGATDSTGIAVVAAPSVYIQMLNLINSGAVTTSPTLRLLEVDERFSVLDGYVHYDFNSPTDLPANMKGQFDRLVCDPPFLSPECQTKMAVTMRWLSRREDNASADQPRIVVCTGERMQPLIYKLYQGVRATTYVPQHTHLSNEFRSYANFECESWKLEGE